MKISEPKPNIIAPSVLFNSLSARTLSKFVTDKVTRLNQLLPDLSLKDFGESSLSNPQKKKRIAQGLQIMIENEGISHLVSSLPTAHLQVLYCQLFTEEEKKLFLIQSDRILPTTNFYRKRVSKRLLEYGIYDACMTFPLSANMVKYMILMFCDGVELDEDLRHLDNAQNLTTEDVSKNYDPLCIFLSQILNAHSTLRFLSRFPMRSVLIQIAKELDLEISEAEIKSAPALISRLSGMAFFTS